MTSLVPTDFTSMPSRYTTSRGTRSALAAHIVPRASTATIAPSHVAPGSSVQRRLPSAALSSPISASSSAAVDSKPIRPQRATNMTINQPRIATILAPARRISRVQSWNCATSVQSEHVPSIAMQEHRLPSIAGALSMPAPSSSPRCAPNTGSCQSFAVNQPYTFQQSLNAGTYYIVIEKRTGTGTTFDLAVP
jgi:hypothetical protein